MSKHKKQHYIPASYLKAWCDGTCPSNQTPYIWMFDADGKNPRRKAPEKVLRETDMYTITREDGTRDLVLEHGLHELEDKFCRIRKKVLRCNRDLEAEERVVLCAFVAAMHSRTPARREHWRNQWGNVLSRAEEIQAWMDNATPEEINRAKAVPTISSDGGDSEDYMSVDNVRELHERPLQMMLASMISIMTAALVRMNLAVLNAPKGHHFLTSDNPCVQFDPTAYKRPPIYRSSGLYHPKVEITLPISPYQTVFFSWPANIGYVTINSAKVDEINRRTRFHAYESFVLNKNESNPFWFDPGIEPEDSWEKTCGLRRADSIRPSTEL